MCARQMGFLQLVDSKAVPAYGARMTMLAYAVMGCMSSGSVNKRAQAAGSALLHHTRSGLEFKLLQGVNPRRPAGCVDSLSNQGRERSRDVLTQ